MPCVTSITRRFSSICPHSFLCKVAFYYLLCVPSYSSRIHWTNRIFFVQEQKDLWMNNPSDFWEREKNLRQIPGLLTFLAGTWPSQVGYKREARVNLSSQQLLLRRDKELVNFLFLPPPLIWQIHSLEFRIFLISRPTFLFSSQPLLSLSFVLLFPRSASFIFFCFFDLSPSTSSVSSSFFLHIFFIHFSFVPLSYPFSSEFHFPRIFFGPTLIASILGLLFCFLPLKFTLLNCSIEIC